jgi:hypothetical protein
VLVLRPRQSFGIDFVDAKADQFHATNAGRVERFQDGAITDAKRFLQVRLVPQRHSFRVSSLPISTTTRHENLSGAVQGQPHLDAFEKRLKDNTQTPVLDQVAFRCDFPAWLTTRTERDRRLIEDISRDERTTRLAQRFGLSKGPISQLRREYQQAWRRFVGDREATSTDRQRTGPRPAAARWPSSGSACRVWGSPIVAKTVTGRLRTPSVVPGSSRWSMALFFSFSSLSIFGSPEVQFFGGSDRIVLEEL